MQSDSPAESSVAVAGSTPRIRNRITQNQDDIFRPISLFEIPIFALKVSDWADHQKQLVKRIRKLRKKHPSMGRSNYGGYHSGPEFSAESDPHIRWVTETATRFARRALSTRYDGWKECELTLGSYWASVLDKGNWTLPHHHAPQDWSCAYYVQVGEQPSPESDDRSGMIEFINPTGSFGAGPHQGNFAVAPTNGMIVLFPSPLVHFVHPYHGDSERIVVAHNFNLNVR